MSSPVTAHSAVSAEPPRVPVAEIELAVERQFGCRGSYLPLVSERDQNFRLKTSSGAEYVVKVTSAAEPRLVSDFQIAALLHLENVGTVCVPKVVPALDGRHAGRIEYAGKSHMLRLVSYLAGEPLTSVPVNADVARDLGGSLARLDLGLDGFFHEGERPVLLWDLQRAPELRDLLDRIDNPAIRRIVLRAIDDYERRVLPELGSLHAQVIHGDANPENILVDPVSGQVTGFIDFGDMVRAPLVFDVAIAASYLRASEADAIELIAPFVVGYHAVRALSVAELELLFDLVRVRLATTVTLLYWRLDARDHDDAYRQKTLHQESDAIDFLTLLDDLGRARFSRELQRAVSGRAP
ncbi:MAG: phosphotransferase [Gammaproteobacteria bacterium]|nr:phosphotransferase [Gammaproteobacteria bacterium]MBT8111764.1 phosphotransferase [Gammaproteobacteria bacterium]NND47162.1 phosphotransferase [Woeseiaceae bacterium]NNL46463.1 phosphotransferase [Woeseiaceae bacterium]